MSHSLNHITLLYASAYSICGRLTVVDKFEIGKLLKEWTVASANACVLGTALLSHKCLGEVLSSKENTSEKYSLVFIKCLVCVLYRLEVCLCELLEYYLVVC